MKNINCIYCKDKLVSNGYSSLQCLRKDHFYQQENSLKEDERGYLSIFPNSKIYVSCNFDHPISYITINPGKDSQIRKTYNYIVSNEDIERLLLLL